MASILRGEDKERGEEKKREKERERCEETIRGGKGERKDRGRGNALRHWAQHEGGHGCDGPHAQAKP